VEPREKRRDMTWRKVRRTQLVHFKVVHPNGTLDCPCEFSVWMFAKRKPVGCGCRKKKFGQPKSGSGVCHSIGESIRARRSWRAEAFRWLRWRGDGDDLVGD
jgi:hypothetical protein